jgi:hypothetical protein
MNGEFVDVSLEGPGMPRARPPKQTEPLCKDLEDSSRNGLLHMYCQESIPALQNSLTGLFSFVYYFVPPQDSTPAMYRNAFLNSAYYKGLKIYLDFVHDPLGTCERGEVGKRQHFEQFKGYEGALLGTPKEQELIQKAIDYPPLDPKKTSRFKKWGVIVYTDERTRTLLETVFPYADYPKLILAVVEWPFYATKAGRCEPTIMRCMRFQVMELFPTQTICIRDADTLFVNLLERQYPTESVKMATEEETRKVHEKFARTRDYATYMVLWWESEFMKAWASEETSPIFSQYQIYSQLIIGSSLDYSKPWHTNIPIELPLSEKVNARKLVSTMRQKTQKPVSHTSTLGLYAGFVNLSKQRNQILYIQAIQHLWKDCVEYLESRYFMAGPDRLISDVYCRPISGAAIGKDERLLLFVFSRVENIQAYTTFYNIEYGPTEKPLVQLTEWPLFTAGPKFSMPFFDNLCTPYYNDEIKRATITVSLQSYLNERHNAIQDKYAYFIETFDVPTMKTLAHETAVKCNPLLKKEQLFLEKADVRPIQFESRGLLGGGKRTKRSKRNRKRQTRRRSKRS